MTFASLLRHGFVVLALALGSYAHAELFTSSASSAGSASSGSVSDSLKGSSNSLRDDKKTADGDYRITDVAQAPDRAGFRRVTMQADETKLLVVLELPAAVIEKQGLGRGDLVHAAQRAYGYAFARGDTREAFYLVLADDWHRDLAARPVARL